MFALTTANAEKGNGTIQGILFLYSIDVRVLFDMGSTYFFIAPYVVCHVPISRTTLLYYFFVTTPRDMVLMVVRYSEIARLGCTIGNYLST